MINAIRFDPIRLPPAAEQLRHEVRDFLHKEISTGTFSPLGDGPSFNREFSRRVGVRGWIGMTWPKQYGGQERSFLERYVVTEEFRVVNAPVRAHFTADRQSGPMLLKFATEDLKQDILPRIVKGECTFCIGMSEPDSGSDLFAASTKAEKMINGWHINGRKLWTTNAQHADYMIAIFRTSVATSENRRHGLSQFLVDMKLPGISIRPVLYPSGQHEFNEVTFDDVVLPEHYLLGEADMAWKQATSELSYERSGPERFLETIQVLIELVRLYGKKADTRGAENIGRLVAQLHTLRRMSISVAGMLVAGKEPVLEAAVVKDLGTNWEQQLPAIARDLAVLVDADSECRAYFQKILNQTILIAPKLTLQGGTREILRGIIARGLGLR